jgi:predicted ribosome quality control (RQC) complex YloA/Tae2 family protein
MNYNLLFVWTKEFPIEGKVVESVFSGDKAIRIHFKNNSDLWLIVSNYDAYPFLSTSPISTSNEIPIWNQLTHSILTKVSLDAQDRIMLFVFSQRDIFQQEKIYLIIAEFIPPQPNVILAEQNEELIIVDALKKYSYKDNPQRQILPKLPYQPPKTSFIPNDDEITLPLTLKPLQDKEPILCNSVNEYLKNHFLYILSVKEEQERRKAIISYWEKELKKAQQKLIKQMEEQNQAEKDEYWRICAEIIKVNLHNIQKGQKVLKTINYFDPELSTIEIELFPDKSPQENMQYYLKKYKKARRGKEKIEQNVAETKKKIKQLENIVQKARIGELDDLPQKEKFPQLSRKLEIAEKLLRLRIDNRFEIVIGRKASENDFIVTQLARPYDWWFHSRLYHGSHILLRCLQKTNPPEELIKICCCLAAWYSKARFSQNVPVDYTQIRYVRKPHKSKSGFVTYTNHKTAFVQPRDLRTVKKELNL